MTAALWFIGIETSFGNSDGVTLNTSRSTNKTFAFSELSTRNTSFTIIPISRDSQGICIPTPNQPLAKLYHVTKRVDEPSIDPEEAPYIQEVACHFKAKSNVHFPHAMQQLYRCYSFWQDYDTKEPFLLLPDGKVFNKLWQHPFISGMLVLFQEQLEVETNHVKFFGEDSINYLSQAPNIHIQPFNGIGNYSVRHTHDLHFLAKSQFGLEDTSATTCEHSKPRIAILNRKEGSLRSLLNAHELANLTEIKELSRDNFVDVKYFEGTAFYQQVAFFRSVDILISPHGAQLTGVAFMNTPCGHVLEIFPKHWSIPGFFGSLVVESGKEYSYLYLSENPPGLELARKRKERMAARAQHLCPSYNVMAHLIRKLADEWRQCCSARERTRGSVSSNDSVEDDDTKTPTIGLRDGQGNCIPPLSKISHIRKRLDEPRIDHERAWDVIKQVCCDINGKSDITVPRAMQQLYRCYTYLQDYHTVEPFLMFPDAKVEQKLRAHPFISGMMEILEVQMEVEVHQRSNFSEKALDALLKTPTIDVQAFDVVGNFSLRHSYELHNLAKNQFELDDTSSTTCERAKPRIAILHREDEDSNGSISQLAKTIEDLSRNSIVNVKHFGDTHFREQVAFFRSVDILISPHGPHLAGLAFMNAPCAHVLEIFTKENARPGVYGSLALESGKDYTYLHMPEDTLHGRRAKDKEPDQCSSSDMLDEAVGKLTDEWRLCCEAREWNADL